MLCDMLLLGWSQCYMLGFHKRISEEKDEVDIDPICDKDR